MASLAPVRILRTERLVIVAFPARSPVPGLRSKKGVRELLKTEAAAAQPDESQEEHGLRFFCLSEKDEVEVGSVTATLEIDTGIYFVGYSIHPKYRRMGFATEAVRSVVESLLLEPGAQAVVAETFSDWAPSIAIMRKAGMSRVDTDLGPDIVRYGIVRPGSSVDVTERVLLTLNPFRYPSLYSIRRYLRWLWAQGQELVLLVTCGILAFAHPNGYWIALCCVAFVAYSAYLMQRFLPWWRQAAEETLIQMRESGVFWASRAGTGALIPWRTFTYFKLPRRKGLEIWNGREWFWIPPHAFSGSSLEQAQTYLIEHGAALGEPPLDIQP